MASQKSRGKDILPDSAVNSDMATEGYTATEDYTATAVNSPVSYFRATKDLDKTAKNSHPDFRGKEAAKPSVSGHMAVAQPASGRIANAADTHFAAAAQDFDS